MKKLLKMTVAALTMTAVGFAFGQGRSGEADALNLLAKVKEYVKANGIEKAMVEFNDLKSPFNTQGPINKNADMYLFGTNRDGVQTIHGKNPKMKDKPLKDARDGDGVYFIQEFNKGCFESKDGTGKIRYRFTNPTTQKLEQKIGYVVKVADNVCVGTGIYEG